MINAVIARNIRDQNGIDGSIIAEQQDPRSQRDYREKDSRALWQQLIT